MTEATSDQTEETRRLLRDSVAAFVERSGGLRRLREWRDRPPGFDRGTWREMAGSGWFGTCLPEAHGGLGLGFAELAVIMEELGRGLAPEPVAAAVVLAGGAILHGDAPVQKGRLLPALIDGSLIPALAWQEREGDYGTDRIETVARAEGGDALLTGTKRFVAAPEGADGFLVAAREEAGPALYWVERDAPGLSLAAERRVDGGFVGSLTLDRVRVGRDGRVASPAVAAVAVARAVDEARLAASAELLGVMAQALDITVAYVKQRVQFGRPIGSFQALQHRIVDLWTQMELARSAVLHAAALFDRSEDAASRAAAVSAAKARCSDAALLVTRQAIQLHGGIGYTDEADIGLFLKRALVLSAWLGNAKAMRDRFAAVAGEA